MTEVINTILKYSYEGLLLRCFILSLGNRPQGSNRTYTLVFVEYAIFALYNDSRLPRSSLVYERVGQW